MSRLPYLLLSLLCLSRCEPPDGPSSKAPMGLPPGEGEGEGPALPTSPSIPVVTPPAALPGNLTDPNLSMKPPAPVVVPAPGVSTNPNVATQPPVPLGAAQPVAFPALQFISNPSGTDPNAVVLTFDDGPDGSDGGQTAYILDQLKALGVKASFFVCGHVYTDVPTDPKGQGDIRRIVAEGHTLGSHTMRHPHLGDAGINVLAEMNDNQNMVWAKQVLGQAVPAMATYRAPFGDPFQTNLPDRISRVAPLTQAYGVHVGWSITSNDVGCAAVSNPNAPCIVNNVKAALDKGRSGIILMHAVYRITGDALPGIVAEVKRRGMHFVTVDQLIQAKYGATPEAIMAANKQAAFTPAQISAQALTLGKLNNDAGTAQ
jgi:peptidoglycan/xylan/chitin deacetylase (PgdA/CDA1 family)